MFKDKRFGKIGFHISISGSISRVVDRAVKKGCDTLQMFSKNPRSWASRKIDQTDIDDFRMKIMKNTLWPIFIHTPYLLNLASPKEYVYRKSVIALIDELRTADELGVPYIVTHVGSHLSYGKSIGFDRIVNAINESFSVTENDVIILLENTAGSGNSIGSSFEDINHIISKIKNGERIGVCFDTCHGFAAGYNLTSREGVEDVISHFDEIIGLHKLKLVHLNDSKGKLGSKIDRHEHIGMGKIGEQGMKHILKSKFGRQPIILETPVDTRRNDSGNLIKVKELLFGVNYSK